MNLAMEKLVAILIFVIVLVVLLIFINIPNVMGVQINSQQELRSQAYIENGCPEALNTIKCGSKYLDDLTIENGLDVNQTRNFCGCPK
jgi:hypothetical protein